MKQWIKIKWLDIKIWCLDKFIRMHKFYEKYILPFLYQL